MKGLIPAAGIGTRLGPITRAIPKELLMVGEKACIEHVVEAFKTAGITNIVIVVGWKKNAILDYFGSGKRLDTSITYVVQDEQNGLAQAVDSAHPALNSDAFAVILGDNFFYPKTFLRELIEFHKEKHSECTVGVTPMEDVSLYGVIKPQGDRIIDIVEKPKQNEAPSNLACAGIYVFEPSIFDAIKKTKPDKNNEYQLTDSIKIMVQEKKPVFFKELHGQHIDIGTPERLKMANKFFAQQP
jgi:UDP-N-acetylglucosamine diphosphorylase / glucose-1-phosphate thymidylyltransferase / UDP-N-acetylgalactosamine diphosphorylase / glucosamine-1-phosphate N-acetyltransferase / galactosamine-1-phosphate N-acetyltransferase